MSDCLFCKIAQKTIPADIVYEDDGVIAFRDIEPQAPLHILVIPKKHYGSLMDMAEADDGALASHIMIDVIPQVVRELDLAENGFRVVTNIGRDGGQTVPHLHFHILGGRSLQWPPG